MGYVEVMGQISPSALHGRWLRSTEEDTCSEIVYRPQSHPFPASRGRDGFELRPDGTVVQVSAGPADLPTRRHGRWRLVGDALHLQFEGDRPSTSVLELTDASPSRIAVKR
jgi:hypothetical protein